MEKLPALFEKATTWWSFPKWKKEPQNPAVSVNLESFYLRVGIPTH